MTRLTTIFSFLIFLVMCPAVSFSLSGNADTDGKKPIKIGGVLDGTGIDSMRLFQWDGAALQLLSAVPVSQKDSTIEFQFKNLRVPLGVYFIGSNTKNFKALLLGEEPLLKISGKTDAIPQMTISNSPMNDLYLSTMQEVGGLQKQFQGLIKQLRVAGGNPKKAEELNGSFASLDSSRLDLVERTKAANEFIGDIVSLSGYMSFQVNNQGRYKDEAHYFAHEFFKFADLSKESFDRIPQLMETAKTYAYTIVKAGLPVNEQKIVIDKLAALLPAGSKRHKAFLLGVSLGFQSAKADTYFVKYGDRYLAHYGDQNPQIVQYLESNMDKARFLMIGAEAPEIEQANPDGELQSLSSLRGNYVLVDFWASWCGPCRRENPNVVRLYEQYNDKGFEVFGVSLDRDKARWIQAIEKDNLTWHHVSDLKQWQNEAARTYGVGGIPFTLLLDPEGKIIAKNLRGPSLEAKLREIFGE